MTQIVLRGRNFFWPRWNTKGHPDLSLAACQWVCQLPDTLSLPTFNAQEKMQRLTTVANISRTKFYGKHSLCRMNSYSCRADWSDRKSGKFEARSGESGDGPRNGQWPNCIICLLDMRSGGKIILGQEPTFSWLTCTNCTHRLHRFKPTI